MIGKFSPKFNSANKVCPVKDVDFKLQFDGCSKGNPGLAGAGAVIYNDLNKEIWSKSSFVCKKETNNVDGSSKMLY